MEMTRSELITALRRVGLLGSVDSGYFDNMLKSNSGKDYDGEIEALQVKDISQDSRIQQIDERIITLENKPDIVDYSTQISALQEKDLTQDNRISANDAALLGKASLINGKVPYDQLPEFPVGRKVNVADQVARFALPVYADLTIAYQSDTGDAWGLDANADPAISNNWSKLGNAQGIGVASFNGRTGNIGPMSGDYNTGQVTEIVDKRFVTGSQITTWDAKETTTGSQSKATAAQTAAKTYADSTFIPLTQKGATNGIAPLGSDGKVPPSYLPTSTALPNRVWRRPTRTINTWYKNSTNQEMIIHFRTPWTSTAGTRARVQMRDTSGGTIIDFDGISVQATGLNYWSTIDAVVPIGWEYNIAPVSATRVDQYAELSE